MNAPNSCPCCGNSLLRHARAGGTYWFCQTCWQEIPFSASRESQKISYGYEPTKELLYRFDGKPADRLKTIPQKVLA